MFDAFRTYSRSIALSTVATAMILMALVASTFPSGVSAHTGYTMNGYRPTITDPPGSGNAELHGRVYLACSAAENRTVSSYLMEDLYWSSDAQITKYSWADYDTWHARTAHYGYLGYNDDGDTQEYYTRLKYYDPVDGGNSPDYDSSQLATHYTWRP